LRACPCSARAWLPWTWTSSRCRRRSSPIGSTRPPTCSDRGITSPSSSLAAARRLESLAAESPGHVIVAGDMDADAASDSMRFWTGRHVIGDMSVCYRSAWESAHPGEPLATYIPENPNQVNSDWPFRGIDHVLIRCGDSG